MNVLDALADDFLLVSWQLSHKVDRPDHDQQLSELSSSAPLSSVGGTCNHVSVAVLNMARPQTVLMTYGCCRIRTARVGAKEICFCAGRMLVMYTSRDRMSSSEAMPAITVAFLSAHAAPPPAITGQLVALSTRLLHCITWVT